MGQFEVVVDAGAPHSLFLEDLLLDLSRLVPLARRQAAAGEWLDCLLLLGAIGQIVDDHLHRSRSWPKRITEHLARSGRNGGPEVRAARRVTGLGGAFAAAHPRYRALAEKRDRVLDLSCEVAEVVLGAPEPGHLRSEMVAALRGPWPEQVDGFLTVPSCFRGFDQRPADLPALARELAAAHPDRERPVVVFGVRTSGSYLGPLLAAALRGEGFTASLATVRPTDHLDRGQRAALARAGSSGLAVLVDDPPVSGRALADTADLLIRHGVEADRVVIAIAVPDDGTTLPTALRTHPVVVLPGARWQVDEQFTVDAVRRTLEGLLPAGHTVEELSATPWPGPDRPDVAATAQRGHRRMAFLVSLADGAGDRRRRTLLVESVGTGLFGAHAAAVAHRLAGWVPESLGVVDGCHLQWLPDAVEGDAGGASLDDAGAADYLLARHRALPVAADRTLDVRGRQSVWEVAAEVFSDALGPAAPVLRPVVVEPAVRRLLGVVEPSVIDGRMEADAFLVGSEAGVVVKLSASEGAFSHRDLASYDPVFDVAALADLPFGRAVRHRWEAAVGRAVEPERWLLHRLVHGWDQRRHGTAPEAVADGFGRALRAYVGEVCLAGVSAARSGGPVVALDVDGVLETAVLGTSSPGRDGILALRALVAHGYRVIPVTGRSAADVADRLGAWGLDAGVAEYGTMLVDGVTGSATDLRSDGDRRLVEALRGAVRALEGVEVDDAYRGIVRAFRVDRSGERSGLSAEDLAWVRALVSDPDGLCVVPGEDQSDLTPASCTKATGLRALLTGGAIGVGIDSRPPTRTRDDLGVALAVGDGPADLPVLSLAERSVVPRHAAALAGPGISVSRRPYQAGLADAVSGLLGHPPAGCSTCAVELDPAARFVLAVLSVRAGGPRAIGPRLLHVVRAAAAVVRTGR